MKKLVALVSVVMLTIVAVPGVSFSFTKTTTLGVELNILSTCNVSVPSPGWLYVTDITDSTTGTVTELIPCSFTINCSNTAPWTITDNKSGVATGPTTDIASTLVGAVNPAVTVDYSVHYTPNAGIGSGSDQVITITGDVTQAAYTGKSSQQYQDQIVFTVTY